MKFAVGVCGMCPKFLRNILFESFRQVGFWWRGMWEYPCKIRKSKEKLRTVSGHAEYFQCFLLRALGLKMQ